MKGSFAGFDCLRVSSTDAIEDYFTEQVDSILTIDHVYFERDRTSIPLKSPEYLLQDQSALREVIHDKRFDFRHVEPFHHPGCGDQDAPRVLEILQHFESFTDTQGSMHCEGGEAEFIERRLNV